MPHHGVIRTDRKTMKLQVVYDGSANSYHFQRSIEQRYATIPFAERPGAIKHRDSEMRFCRLVFGLRPFPEQQSRTILINSRID